jgi:hexosaminidase
MMPEGFDPLYEQYSLEIDTSGKVEITSNYRVGVIRAMDTLSQIFDRSGTTLSLPFLPILINDSPRYGYRGLLLDISRAYYPVETLKKLIEGLQMTKINVLHLHITDDDSIAVKLPSFPDMTNFTAFSKSEVYSEDNIKDLVTFANLRGIKIIPEFDVPGHIRAFGEVPSLREIMT